MLVGTESCKCAGLAHLIVLLVARNCHFKNSGPLAYSPDFLKWQENREPKKQTMYNIRGGNNKATGKNVPMQTRTHTWQHTLKQCTPTNQTPKSHYNVELQMIGTIFSARIDFEVNEELWKKTCTNSKTARQIPPEHIHLTAPQIQMHLRNYDVYCSDHDKLDNNPVTIVTRKEFRGCVFQCSVWAPLSQ